MKFLFFNKIENKMSETKTEVKNAPSNSSDEVFELHEGTKVSVLASREGWHQISMSNGITGWVREDHITVI